MWVHVPKNAGELVCEWAHKADELIVSPADTACNWATFDQCYKHTGQKRDWTTCSNRTAEVEKFGYTWEQIAREVNDGDLCLDAFMYGIVLRDPVARLESFVNYFEVPARIYNDILSLTPSDSEGYPGHDRNQWDSWHKYDYWRWNFDNFLVRMLGGYATMVLPIGGVNITHFQNAVSLLRKFDIVIPIEHLTSGVAQFTMDAKLGWHIEDAAERINPTEHAVRFSPKDVARIIEINQFDIALYNYFAKPYELRDRAAVGI